MAWAGLPKGESSPSCFYPSNSIRQVGPITGISRNVSWQRQETCLLCYSPCHLEHSFLRNCLGHWSFVPRSGSLGTLRDPFLSILISMPIILLCIHIYLFYIGLNCFYAFTMHAAQSHLRWAATEIKPN